MAWQGESCVSLRNSAEAGRGDPFPWSPWSQREAVSWRIPEPQNGPCPFPGEVWARLGQAGLLECPSVQPVTAAVVPPLLQTEDRYLLPQFRTLGTGK